MTFADLHNEEQILIPGYIQAFGYLIGLDLEDLRIRFCSENIYSLFDINENILGWKITDFADFFSPILDSPVFFESVSSKTPKYNYGLIQIQNNEYYLTVYTYQSNVYIELEASAGEATTGIEILKGLVNLRTVHEEENIWEELVERLSKIIHYERIMVYKFLDDGTGTVIAEHKLNHVESYLGLHYPASDFPPQTKVPYKLKHNQIFSNVYAENVPILSQLVGDIDLTYSNLRTMSPEYANYIKKAGLASVFCTSIIIEEELWGLVIFQNSKPLHIDYSKRIQAEMLTQMSSSLYTSYLHRSNLNFAEQLEAKLAALKMCINHAKTLPDGIISVLPEIRQLLNTDGVAYMCVAGLFTEGHTPNREKIIEMRTSALFQSSGRLASTDNFCEGLAQYDPELPGVLLVKLDDSNVAYIMGFRKEVRNFRRWAAGSLTNETESNERITEQEAAISYAPQEVFSEGMPGRSKEWTPRDLKSAERLRDILLECSAEHMARVEFFNEELLQINKDLESFLYTISHDTARPLSSIKVHAQQLLNSGSPEMIAQRCNGIIKEVDHISGFLGDLLSYSQAKYTGISINIIDPRPIIEDVVRKLILQYNANPNDMQIGSTPPIVCDPMLANQIFQNVIGSAVKYASKHQRPSIKLYGEDDGFSILYHIKGNGIDVGSHQPQEFQGNSLASRIVQNILKRIGGEVFQQPAEGGGIHFTIKFRKML